MRWLSIRMRSHLMWAPGQDAKLWEGRNEQVAEKLKPCMLIKVVTQRQALGLKASPSGLQ